MPEIRPLAPADLPSVRTRIEGYTTLARYDVTVVETPEVTRFELRLVALETPFVKRYDRLDADTARRYRSLLASGHCYGAFAPDGLCVGIALCEAQQWNGSLVIWEFHVAPSEQRQGIGRRMMEAVVSQARSLGLRCVACETQTTNVPAIAFYRAQGFRIVGLNVALYGNDDQARGEMAVFMQRALPP